MSITLEFSPEIEAQIERAARQSHTDVSAFIVNAAAEKARAFEAQIHPQKREKLALLQVMAGNAAAWRGDGPAVDLSDSDAAYGYDEREILQR